MNRKFPFGSFIRKLMYPHLHSISHLNVSDLTSSSLDLLLPASLEELAALGEDLAMCSTCCFEELPSLSPGKSFVKEVPSVFLIPGLQGPPADVLKPLARHIMFPVLFAKLPYTACSLSETASMLVKVNFLYIVKSLLYIFFTLQLWGNQNEHFVKNHCQA